MRPIIQNGEQDVSDEGKQAKDLELSQELKMATKKLGKNEQQIMEMVMTGYSRREICKTLKVSAHTIRATLDKIRSIIK